MSHRCVLFPNWRRSVFSFLCTLFFVYGRVLAGEVEDLEKQLQNQRQLLEIEQRTLTYDQRLLAELESSETMLVSFFGVPVPVPRQMVADCFTKAYLLGKKNYEEMVAAIKDMTTNSNALTRLLQFGGSFG